MQTQGREYMANQEAELAIPSQKIKVTWVGYLSFFSPLFSFLVYFPAAMAGGEFLILPFSMVPSGM